MLLAISKTLLAEYSGSVLLSQERRQYAGTAPKVLLKAPVEALVHLADDHGKHLGRSSLLFLVTENSHLHERV